MSNPWLQQTAYQNVDHAEVNWALLAQQWIAQQQQPPAAAPQPPPPPPPPNGSTDGGKGDEMEVESVASDASTGWPQQTPQTSNHAMPPGPGAPMFRGSGANSQPVGSGAMAMRAPYGGPAYPGGGGGMPGFRPPFNGGPPPADGSYPMYGVPRTGGPAVYRGGARAGYGANRMPQQFNSYTEYAPPAFKEDWGHAPAYHQRGSFNEAGQFIPHMAWPEGDHVWPPADDERRQMDGPFMRGHQHHSSPPVNAMPMMLGMEQRKTLPQWIREGLEKMEREKQKEAEKERLREEREKQRAERLAAKGKSKFESDSEDSGSEDEGKDGDKEPTKDKLYLGRPATPTNGTDAASDAEDGQTAVGKKRSRFEHSPSPVPISEPELRQKCMVFLRTWMTETLLETTNQQIRKLADSELTSSSTSAHSKKAARAKMLAQSQALTALTQLGAAEDDDDGSSGSDTEDDDMFNATESTSKKSPAPPATAKKSADDFKKPSVLPPRALLAKAKAATVQGNHSSEPTKPLHTDSAAESPATVDAKQKSTSPPDGDSVQVIETSSTKVESSTSSTKSSSSKRRSSPADRGSSAKKSSSSRRSRSRSPAKKSSSSSSSSRRRSSRSRSPRKSSSSRKSTASSSSRRRSSRSRSRSPRGSSSRRHRRHRDSRSRSPRRRDSRSPKRTATTESTTTAKSGGGDRKRSRSRSKSRDVKDALKERRTDGSRSPERRSRRRRSRS